MVAAPAWRVQVRSVRSVLDVRPMAGAAAAPAAMRLRGMRMVGSRVSVDGPGFGANQ